MVEKIVIRSKVNIKSSWFNNILIVQLYLVLTSVCQKTLSQLTIS